MKVVFYNNGNTMVFGKDGDQKLEFQKSWFGLYINFLKESGIDLEATEFEMPDGQHAQYIEEYNNWTII